MKKTICQLPAAATGSLSGISPFSDARYFIDVSPIAAKAGNKA
jgi:hypothetical protein